MMSDLFRRLGRVAAAFGLAASLAACATLGAGEAPSDIYDLTAPSSFEGLKGRSGVQLLIPTPSAIEALSSPRIAVRPEPTRIAYYPGAVWSDTLPAMLQAKVVRAFENAGRMRAVGRPGESLAIDYQVIIDVRAFEMDVADGRKARVELGVKLLDDRNGRVRASRVFRAEVAGAADRADAAVAALDAASRQVITEVVIWTASTI